MYAMFETSRSNYNSAALKCSHANDDGNHNEKQPQNDLNRRRPMTGLIHESVRLDIVNDPR
jgi:hypothetical protein